MTGRAHAATETPQDRTLAELRALHALAEAINRSNSPEAVYPETLQTLCGITQADRAAILLFDSSGVMRFVAWDGLSDRYRAAAEGHNPWAANETNPLPIMVADPSSEPTLAPLLPQLGEEGIASLAFVPIAHQGRLLGKFMLYSNRPHEMAADEIRLALTVAEYLALAVSRQRAIEEVRRLNADLAAGVQRRTRQLEEAHREMESFCYSISHDLRAPLRALDGFARILREDAGSVLDEAGHDSLRRIIAASARLGRLMDELLKLSRIGRVGMRLKDIDLADIAAEILGQLRVAEPGRRASARLASGLRVKADAGLMRIALENLLGNAWKFTHRMPEARIELGRLEQDGKTCFFVRDNGAGFDLRYATKLFSPFQRVHAPGEYEGTGIGLAFVQRIVHRHGGRVWAEAEPGRGATFYFTLWADGLPAEPEAPASSRPFSPAA